MGHKTPLFEIHEQAGAQMVEFAGWDMPLHYGSQIDEHHAVRREAGIFDVSHMTIVDLEGSNVKAFLQKLVANDVDKLKENGRALYTCMLNEQGGILDDLIVYKLGDENYRLIVNAATRAKDLEWIGQQASGLNLELKERSDLAMLAVQGPRAWDLIQTGLTTLQREQACTLKPFQAVDSEGWFIARTGYTGEDGFEVLMPNAQAPAFWQSMMSAGVAACGLGARDTLRLEAGMMLYGTDMDETTTPLEAGLAWTVALQDEQRQFVGRDVLEQQKQNGLQKRMVGVVLKERAVPRAGYLVHFADGSSAPITSGTFSPTLERGVALVYAPLDIDKECSIEIRNKKIPARIIKLPFVREGRQVFREKDRNE